MYDDPQRYGGQDQDQTGFYKDPNTNPSLDSTATGFTEALDERDGNPEQNLSFGPGNRNVVNPYIDTNNSAQGFPNTGGHTQAPAPAPERPVYNYDDKIPPKKYYVEEGDPGQDVAVGTPLPPKIQISRRSLQEEGSSVRIHIDVDKEHPPTDFYIYY
jgi:hypothetical protein